MAELPREKRMFRAISSSEKEKEKKDLGTIDDVNVEQLEYNRKRWECGEGNSFGLFQVDIIVHFQPCGYVSSVLLNSIFFPEKKKKTRKQNCRALKCKIS